MTAIREHGEINENTFLIDYGLFGIARAGAIYLIKGEKKCVIDGGTHSEAPRIFKFLKELNAFPPDKIILTHAHWDHTQAVPYLRKKAADIKKNIEVLASEKAVPLLEDQSWNEVFGQKSYADIKDVIPLKEGDIVDLGGVSLKILDVPGHSKDHIAILDEKNKNIFVGDAVGVKTGDQFLIPPFQPPFWDKDAFYKTVNKLKETDYNSLCLAHFGYIYEEEAKGILEEAVSNYELWWDIFEKNTDKLDDTRYMLEVILKETDLVYPEIQLNNPMLKIMLGLMTGLKKIIGKKSQPVGELILLQIIGYLVKGFKIYKSQQT